MNDKKKYYYYYSDLSKQHSKVLYCWGPQEKRKYKKTWKSGSTEEVVGFSLASPFHARKYEAVTQGARVEPGG